jgi:phage terminase large subunit-like protein
MARKPSTKDHPAEIYARQAASGAIVVSKWVRMAAKRHLRDLETGHTRGIYFDPLAAERAIGFFSFLRHSKGEWAGKEFELSPWQLFILWCLFGWRREGGVRRFRSAYVEVARKNGKSTLCAGVGLYLFCADGEPGAEVYCLATKKDQARIVFVEAERMRAASPSLAKRIVKFRDNMNVPKTSSKFEPLGSDEDTLDGLNIHGAIVDELHAHKTRALLDVIDTATGARRQPLLFKITTSGSDRETVCWKEHEYGTKVLEGIATGDDADATFVYIAGLDPGDDWKDEANWPKANPNLEISVKIDDLRRKANKAKNDPSSLNAILRLHFNVWTNQETAAIDVDKWNLCTGYSLAGKDAKVLRAELEEQLAGRRCYLAVDLSSTEDVTAAVKLFPPDEEGAPYIAIPHFYLPEDNLQKKIEEWRVPYDVWVREGFITATDGNVVDYDVVKAQILSDVERYDVTEITFDPWNATQFANDLQKAGIPEEKLVKFPQTIAMYAEPTKRLLETLIPAKRLAHLGNPVLRWMASNLLVKEDNNGNKRPVKKSKRGKIDGIVALLMALGRSISNPSDNGGSHSLYSEGRGVFLA